MVINMKYLLLLVLILNAALVSAESRTGLASTLIKEWHSSVDTTKCKDFRYPSYAPSLPRGEKIYKSNCASCHGEIPKANNESIRKVSPELQFESLCGGSTDPKHNFSKTLDVAQRWDVLMYYRANSLGYFKAGSPELAKMDAIFGGNCAVCHGTRGQGDGNLHKSLYPPPANFTMAKRLYTRTDERLFNELTHGIPWTAMPAWKNRYDFDKQIYFDEAMIWNLVRYVRQFGFSQEVDRLDTGREKLETYKKSVGLK
jgi:mono/diheme cytochrome c family protein